MATITKTVKSSGGDYTTLAAWDAGEAQDLTDAGGDIAVADIYALQDTAIVSMSASWVTSAACYVSMSVNAAARHAGKWDDAKYRLETTATAIANAYAGHLRIDGFQIKITGGWIGFYMPSPTGDIRITNSIVILNDASAVGVQTGDAANVKLNNVMFYAPTDAAPAYIGVYQGSSGTLYAENCLIHSFAYGVYGGTGTTTFKNVGILNCATPVLGTVGETTDSTTVPTFVSEVGRDFHLQAGDTIWKDQGTDLTADAGWVLAAVDIDGQARSGTWDIGPDEYVAATSFIPRIVGII